MLTPGCACWNSAMTSGRRYVPEIPAARTESEPDRGSRNAPIPRAAWARIASARNRWLARRSPEAVKAPDRRSISVVPSSSSRSAICLETAGWLMRSSSAAPENDLRRTNPAKARKRASTLITQDYTSLPHYAFLFCGSAEYLCVSSKLIPTYAKISCTGPSPFGERPTPGAFMRRRDFLKASAAFAGAAASGFSCVEIASAAPIDVPTVDKLTIRVLVDQQHDQFLRGSTVNGVVHEGPGPGRSASARNVLHNEWGLSLYLESQRSDENRTILLDFGYTGTAIN